MKKTILCALALAAPSLMAWSPVRKVKSVWEDTKQAVSSGASTVGGAVSSGASAVGGAVTSGAQAVGGAVTSGAQAVGNTATQAWEGTKDIAEKGAQKIEHAAVAVKDTVVDAAQTVADKAEDLVADAKETLVSAKEILEAMTDNAKTIFDPQPTPSYASTPALQPYAPTINDPAVIAADAEWMIPLIQKYSPVLYLCKELSLPIAAEDYFTDVNTEVAIQPGHLKNENAPIQIIIPKGQVTMAKLYDLKTQYNSSYVPDLYVKNADYVNYGSNPAKFTDAQGNLSTPAYVMTYNFNGKIYINYIYIYGLNRPYTIKIPAVGLPLLKGDILNFQNAHEFDLEHMTLELNAESKQIERIFFGSHGADEGVWLPANSPDIQYEGTHPVVYVANGGHGCYPKAGIYVRIYGFANDITARDRKWVPQLVMLYPEKDPRFDKNTMGWMYFPGDYGRRGVSALFNKGWFLNGDKETKSGQPYSKMQKTFCHISDHKNVSAWVERQKELARARKAATPPGHN